MAQFSTKSQVYVSADVTKAINWSAKAYYQNFMKILTVFLAPLLKITEKNCGIL